MNVSLQNIDKVSAELTVKLEKADYQEKVDKELKSLRQKAQIPGFRKGMVPTSLIKKMYGKSVIAEVVNKTLQEAVYNYIKENKDKTTFTDSEIEFLANVISSHMGIYNTNPYSDVVLPIPHNKYQRFVHMCDFLASRKFLDVKFENNEIKE